MGRGLIATVCQVQPDHTVVAEDVQGAHAFWRYIDTAVGGGRSNEKDVLFFDEFGEPGVQLGQFMRHDFPPS